eukprot:6340450-Prymnesium_polylepis.1
MPRLEAPPCRRTVASADSADVWIVREPDVECVVLVEGCTACEDALQDVDRRTGGKVDGEGGGAEADGEAGDATVSASNSIVHNPASLSDVCCCRLCFTALLLCVHTPHGTVSTPLFALRCSQYAVAVNEAQRCCLDLVTRSDGEHLRNENKLINRNSYAGRTKTDQFSPYHPHHRFTAGGKSSSIRSLMAHRWRDAINRPLVCSATQVAGYLCAQKSCASSRWQLSHWPRPPPRPHQPAQQRTKRL